MKGHIWGLLGYNTGTNLTVCVTTALFKTYYQATIVQELDYRRK